MQTGYCEVLVNGHPGEAYNIRVETPEMSVSELADEVVALSRELFDYKGKVVMKYDHEYLIDNPDRRCPVITRAREQIGHAPTFLVDEGLRRALIWYSGDREVAEA